MRKTFLSSRLTTSLILVIFLLFHALRNSLAHAHQAKVASALPRQDHVISRKVLVDANNHVAKANKATALGGRKMAMTRKVQEDDHGVTMKNPTPMLSGNDQEINNASKIISSKSLHDGLHSQVEEKAFANSPNTQDGESRTKKDFQESKRLKEMMELMYKDYRGRGGPRRRPPINNYYPRP